MIPVVDQSKSLWLRNSFLGFQVGSKLSNEVERKFAHEVFVCKFGSRKTNTRKLHEFSLAFYNMARSEPK